MLIFCFSKSESPRSDRWARGRLFAAAVAVLERLLQSVVHRCLAYYTARFNICKKEEEEVKK